MNKKKTAARLFGKNFRSEENRRVAFRKRKPNEAARQVITAKIIVPEKTAGATAGAGDTGSAGL